MEGDESSTFDRGLLGQLSKRVCNILFSALPDLEKYASCWQSVENDGLSLSLTVPSPTGDEQRSIYIWIDERATPSIGFGPAHCHEAPDEVGIAVLLDLTIAILADEFVVAEEIGGEHPRYADWLDLREDLALEEVLTCPSSSGRILIKSFSGAADREISLSRWPSSG